MINVLALTQAQIIEIELFTSKQILHTQSFNFLAV